MDDTQTNLSPEADLTETNQNQGDKGGKSEYTRTGVNETSSQEDSWIDPMETGQNELDSDLLR